ncbi:MAG: lysostaphin resistance A-like protein [Bacteroidota bacterium]
MTENSSIWKHPVIFFITRSFILMGMMLVFGGFGYSVSMFTAKALFGIDFLNNPDLINQMNNTQVIHALKYVQVVASIGLFVAPAWFFCRALNTEPVEYLKLNRKTTVAEIVSAIMVMIASMPVVSWMIYVNENVKFPPSLAQLEAELKLAESTAAKLTEAFVKADNLNTLFVNIFVVALIPAISEEFLFRGALQNFLRHTFKHKHVAVILTALIFSAFHGQFYGSLPRFALGAVLGYAYLFTGNLWTGIAMHFFNNAIAVIMSYQGIQQLLPDYMKEGYVFEAWYINVGSAIACVLCLLLLRKVTFRRVWYNGE